MLKYYRKHIFVENVWLAKSALFIYVSTHYVETVKSLDYNRYSQFTIVLGGAEVTFNSRL